MAAVSTCYGVLGLGKIYGSICLHRLIASMLALSFLPAIIVMTFTMYLAPRFLRGLGSVAEPIYPANSILQGCGFACHFARRLLHSLLDHVHRLYPVELTEFVDDVTHKVEGTGASVLRVFSRSVEYVAREMRALGLTVSLKSGMAASSRDFGRLLLNTLAESDVRMGLQDHIRDLGFDAYTGRRPVSALLFDGGTGQRSEQERSHTYARATVWGDGFFLVGSTRSRCMPCSSLGSLRWRCVLFEGRQREGAPRSVKADVSRHCSPWRWESMIRRRRSLETCWSSGSTSGSISQRPNAKECTVLGTCRNLALFRLPGGTAGTQQQLLQRCANSNGTRRDQCSGLRWMVISFLLPLTVRPRMPGTCAVKSQRQSTSSCGRRRHNTNRERAYSGALICTPPDCILQGSGNVASTKRQIFSWPVSQGLYGLCNASTTALGGETPIDPTCKRCDEL